MELLSFMQACGGEDTHVDFDRFEQGVHRDLAEPLLQLKNEAKREGFELCVASGFRSFERQLAIWNAKASGARPLLSASGALLSAEQLEAKELMYAILRWSALPGGSRHHWGTDIDVYDATALPEGYQLQLTLEEARGMFAPFYRWLGEHLGNTGFYRPYDGANGGVAEEPWHLSYQALASKFQQALQPEHLKHMLEQQDILLKAEILESFDELYSTYISKYFVAT
ncbi:LD-carboxypeptidase LdcB, LAS superfamily [Alteromonadaceae bacterium Bs31]|nr:LD-carboxypeptidase LdcB, LAS superfamily [Alteromonadaceae bacterium Bs31]